MTTGRKEKRFLDALESLFTGAEVEGNSGFVNLMHIKHNYFKSVCGKLMTEIDKRAEKETAFREELFDKLYTFFGRHFCESGAIYFRNLPALSKSKTYERVYTDDRDVALSWKTQTLYYVKSDVLVRSMPIELRDRDNPKRTKLFYFDASGIEHNQNNKRREFVFEFIKVEKQVVHLAASSKKNNRKTDIEDIIKKVKKTNSGKITLTEDDLQNAFRVFKRQTEVDLFINKDARSFLREQFNLWIYQYLFQGETIFEEKRIRQIQAIKDTAYDIIDFIAQFEDELVKIWNKPKFAKNSNYVIPLERINNKKLVGKIKKHKNFSKQTTEWTELGISKENAQAPIDTKYFKDLEIEILGQLGDLDKSLDGWLIKSENYQALNTILPKFKEQIQTIYIDPPFNTGDDFDYLDHFRDSSWLSLIYNRLEIAKSFLTKNGNIFVQLDWNANHLGKILLQNLFPQCSEIIWNTNATKDEEAGLFSYKSFGAKYVRQHDTLFQCATSDDYKFIKLWKPNRNTTQLNIGWLDLISIPNKPNPEKIEDYDFFIEKYDAEGNLNREEIQATEKIFPIGDVWNDTYSFMQSELRTSESLGFKTQKPENLLRRIIQSTTEKNELILDYFCGSGTTISVAHKLKRKWIGIESSDHFNEFWFNGDGKKIGMLGRMKIVVSGDKSFTAVDKKRRPHLSKDIDWRGGGAFKYYTLEQYEETLRNSRYADSDELELNSLKSPFEQYVFFGDDKLAHIVKHKTGKKTGNGSLEINLHDLYPNLDIAESLSNILGKQIRRLTADKVTFTDGTTKKINPANMTKKEKQDFISLIKPYLWWGE